MFHIIKCEQILLGQQEDIIKSADGVISYLYYWDDKYINGDKEAYKIPFWERKIKEIQTDRVYNAYMARRTLARIYEKQGNKLQAIIHYEEMARFI